MKMNKFVIALLAIFFGVFALIYSLFATATDLRISSTKESEKKFYISSKILPDHILYPILMAVDKSLLLITSGESEAYLMIRLAQDRMLSAQKLLEKNEEEFALSTITKSQKYLILAASLLFSENDPSLEAERHLLQALVENTKNLEASQRKFKTVSTTPIDGLIVESETLIMVLENRIP